MSAVRAARHSQIWINHPVQGLRDLKLGLDQDWWLHVLVNPRENDVITTERERQRNLDEKTWLCIRGDMCHSRAVIEKKNPLNFTKSEITGCLATGNTHIYSRMGPLPQHLTTFVDGHRQNCQSSTTKGNRLASVLPFSSQSSFF